jgi:hypothetical protein
VQVTVAARFVKHILPLVCKGESIEEVVDIPVGMEGRVIGKDGKNTESMRASSGAFMRILGPGKLLIKGTPEQVCQKYDGE